MPGDHDDPPPGAPRTGVMTSSEVVAMRHPELDDAPLRSRYGLEGKLGRGGMAVVAEAVDRRIGRRVAVKRLAGPPTAEMVERFVREARVQGRLDHPAVVPVYDLGIQSDGRPFFAMRKLAGVTLAELLHRQASGDEEARAYYPRRRLLEALVDVCLAIEYAHTRGVIHRDLKPANVVLGEFGEVYVLDWGVARVLDEVGAVPALDGGAGTVGYMAPEQARGDVDVDARADVYALGCLLFEILAGKPLHEPGVPVDPHPSRRAVDREIPTDLDLVCARALVADRKERFASARLLADAVQRHLDADHDAGVQRDEAAAHAARATVALDDVGPPGDDAGRASAMREAALALALDPANREAAVVVRSLLLEPPTHPAAEVTAALDAADAATVRALARTSAIAYVGQAMFLPLFMMQGVRDWRFIPTMLALIVALFAVAVAAWHGRMLRSWTWISLVGNSLLVLGLSRVLGPFVIPPGVATLVAMGIMSNPHIRQWWLVPICLGLTPILAWALEEVGVLGATVRAAGDHLEFTSTVVDLPAELVVAGLASYVAALIVVAVLFARYVATVHHATRRRLAVQAWHLRRFLGDAGQDTAPERQR